MSGIEDCPKSAMCAEARGKIKELTEAQLAVVYDARFLDFLVRIDKEGTEDREPGAIEKCFEENPDCVWKQLYPDSEFQEDDPNAPEMPSASNFFAGLGG